MLMDVVESCHFVFILKTLTNLHISEIAIKIMIIISIITLKEDLDDMCMYYSIYCYIYNLDLKNNT